MAAVAALLLGSLGTGAAYYQHTINNSNQEHIEKVEKNQNKLSESIDQKNKENETLVKANTNLTYDKNKVENDLVKAENQIKSLNQKNKAYEQEVDTLKKEAKSATDGELTTFALVKGGTPMEPYQYFQGVGQVFNSNGEVVK